MLYYLPLILAAENLIIHILKIPRPMGIGHLGTVHMDMVKKGTGHMDIVHIGMVIFTL